MIAAGVTGAADFSSVQFFNNDFDSLSRGVETEARYTLKRDVGHTEFKLNLSYVDTNVSPRDGSSFTINTSRQYDLENRLPKMRFNLRVDHHAGGWRLTGAGNYFGGYSKSSGNGSTEQSRHEYIVDTEVGYRYKKDWNFVAGIGNLFDKYPASSDAGLGSGMPYVRNSPFGSMGRTYYGNLSYRF